MKEKYSGINSFLYYLVKSKKFISYCTQGSTGTSNSHKRVNPEFMINFKIAYNEKVVQTYASIIISQIHKMNDNQEEIRILTKQRDELLPLLMNGQISVNSDLSYFPYIRSKCS